MSTTTRMELANIAKLQNENNALKAELKAVNNKYAALTIMVSRAESRAVDAIAKERDALKARLEAIRPVPPVSDWLADRLHSSRYRAQSKAYDENFRSFNASLRDWLEVLLGESIESDPWKDKRSKPE